MKTLLASTLVLTLAGCAGASGSPDGGPADPDDGGALAGTDASSVPGPDAGAAVDPAIAAWLEEHNDVRAGATPAPSPALRPLEWSEAGAAVASAWAAQCDWGHNAGRGSYGENIAAATNELTPAKVVGMWASEAADYDYATNTCTDVCGHYTQLVWRDTTAVGCAVQRCTTGSPFGTGTWYYAVCDYAPPGNFVGRKPY